MGRKEQEKWKCKEAGENALESLLWNEEVHFPLIVTPVLQRRTQAHTPTQADVPLAGDLTAPKWKIS